MTGETAHTTGWPAKSQPTDKLTRLAIDGGATSLMDTVGRDPALRGERVLAGGGAHRLRLKVIANNRNARGPGSGPLSRELPRGAPPASGGAQGAPPLRTPPRW